MIYELLGIRTSDDPELAPPNGFEKLSKMTRDSLHRAEILISGAR
jgi:hypothetical protein